MTGRRPIRLFPPPVRAICVDRPNRFLIRARREGRTVPVLFPNPGRMQELVYPGAELLLVPHTGPGPHKTRFRTAAIRKEGVVRLVDTHAANGAAEELLRRRAIPSLAGADVVRREIVHGRSRFDFLLREKGEPVYLEVKSCTLVEKGLCLFPDAPTERGRRHLNELAEIAAGGGRAVVLFLVQHPRARAFLPHVHTDLPFTRALHEAAARFPGSAGGEHPRFRIIAAAVRMDESLALSPRVRELPVPLEKQAPVLGDRGAYLVLLRLARRRRIGTGALGPVLYPAGWYLYAGSAMANLGKRIERHRRLRKRKHWHIDHLREEARFVEAWAFRSPRREECALARAAARIAAEALPRFGSSDCRCPSHLFRFDEDPRPLSAFHELLARFRHRVDG